LSESTTPALSAAILHLPRQEPSHFHVGIKRVIKTAIFAFTAFFKFFADAYPIPATPLNLKSSTRLRSLSLPSCAIMGWAKL
jgi:hypothetical protein